MELYERIQVCIDRPQRDAHMLAYIRAVAPLAKSREIFLVHVRGEPGVECTPVEPEVTTESLLALARDHLAELPAQARHADVLDGSPLLEYLRFAYNKDVDLVVIGRHCGQTEDKPSEALLAGRITRRATCSVLVLPESFAARPTTILVPVRDSACSANALEEAAAIARAVEGRVVALNVFHVSTGYMRVGTTLEEHVKLLESAARREGDHLLERANTQAARIECRCAPDHHGKPVQVIHDTIRELPADLVVIGARGRTGAAGVLLGTITEQLIRESPVPVLAVKKKGECLGILQALLALAQET